jgi:uncharacterized protein (TIGR03435 family)
MAAALAHAITAIASIRLPMNFRIYFSLSGIIICISSLCVKYRIVGISGTVLAACGTIGRATSDRGPVGLSAVAVAEASSSQRGNQTVQIRPRLQYLWFGLGGLFFALAGWPVSVLAQEHAVFDAVAIKRAESGLLYPALDIDPGYLTAKAASLHFLILQAFGIEEFQLTGTAGWMKSDLYSIYAAAGRRVSSPEMMAMLRNMLSSRFHLIFHRETRELPVYALTVDVKGAKLEPLTEAPTVSQLQSKLLGGHLITRSVGSSIQELVHYLNSRTGAAAVGLPVVDHTGLQGLYRIRLTFEAIPNPEGNGGRLDIDYFAALPRELGLRLKRTRAPINLVVVDGAQKPELEH